LVQSDVKGLGKRLLDQLMGMADSSSQIAGSYQQAEDLKQGLKALLRKIELYQLINLKQSGWPDPFYLFIPFWMGNRLLFIELNLSFPRKKNGPTEEEGTSVLFLLNLPALGRVRIEVQIQEKDLFCRFNVSDPQVSEFVHRAFPELKGRLQQMGYHPHLQSTVEKMEILKETPPGGLKKGSQDLLSIII
jgi:flagellar hook-length control protein FliK